MYVCVCEVCVCVCVCEIYSTQLVYWKNSIQQCWMCLQFLQFDKLMSQVGADADSNCNWIQPRRPFPG